MCNVAVMEFFINNIKPEEFNGKRVLGVGSKYINGSVRPLIERFASPKQYIGVDLEPGKYVDIVLPAEKLTEYFKEEEFDVVIATELLEHVKNWRPVVNNMKRVLKRCGYIYVTTRSYGFPYHGFPHDYWRYEVEDVKRIFMDFEISVLERDHEAPGVFLKAKKPESWVPADLDDVALYSILLGKRAREIVELSDATFSRRLMFKFLSSKARRLMPEALVQVFRRRFAQ